MTKQDKQELKELHEDSLSCRQAYDRANQRLVDKITRLAGLYHLTGKQIANLVEKYTT